MDQFVLDPIAAAQLAQTDGHVPVCDPNGRKLGYFVPVAQYDQELYRQTQRLWTDAEVEELSKQSGGVSTDQLLRRLSEL